MDQLLVDLEEAAGLLPWLERMAILPNTVQKDMLMDWLRVSHWQRPVILFVKVVRQLCEPK